MLKGLGAMFRSLSRDERGVGDKRRAGLTDADTEAAGEFAPTPIRQGRAPGAGPSTAEPGGRQEPVEILPSPPVAPGSRVTIRYRGKLAAKNPRQVYLHCGYGPGPWRDVKDVAMEPAPGSEWKATVPVQAGGQFSFCFRDETAWDNNGGRDWSCAIDRTPFVR